MLSPALICLALTTLTTALPSRLVARDPVAQLIAIAPTSASCPNAPIAGECATASDAVAPMIASFTQYAITSAAEQAALISWMAYESADFKYNINHFPAPGQPGQGTRTMMFPANVAAYASSIPALAPQLAGLTDPAAILSLVEPDEYSFAAAAWYQSAKCDVSLREGLQGGTLAGWEAWVSGCLQTSVEADRQAYWERAVQALGVVATTSTS